MKKHWKTRRKIWAKIARERMQVLLELAREEALKGHAQRASRYVALSRKLGMKYNVSLPREYKKLICKKCNAFLLPSVNSQYRLRRGKLTILCKNCKNRMRMPYR